MTRDDYTHIAYVLDRSGSMYVVQDAVASAFNEFVESQRRAPGYTTLGLTLFNTELDQRDTVTPIADIEPLAAGTNYAPGGLTALDDATGATIVETGRVLEGMAEDDRPGHVLFVIHTDGHENSSQRYSRREVIDMRLRQERDYGWTFLFVGADQDAWDNPYGIDARNTISHDHDAESYAAVGVQMTNSASGVRLAAPGAAATLASEPVDLRRNKKKRRGKQ